MRFGRWLSWGSILAIIVLSLSSVFHLITPQTLGILEASLLCCVWLGLSAGKHARVSAFKVIVFIVALAVIAIVWRLHPVLFIYMPAIGVNLFLATFFFSTLRPGCDPLVSRIARIERPDFDDVIAAYTRKVTWAWGLFFTGLLIETIVLIIFTPVETTTLFLNIINYLLIPVFFISEYIFRRIHLRHYTHMSPLVLAARLSRRGIMSVISYRRHD
jgi:uncharacterized membrane protein